MIKTEELENLQCGHRERLRKKFLDGKLTESELLELLLTYAIPRRDVRMLSRQLYKKYGNIHKLLSAPFESLIENDGIKEGTATFLKLMHELITLDYKSILDETPIFHDQSKLEHYCKLIIGGKTIEEFHVLYLDSQYRLIKDETHSSGTIDWAAVYIREIVKKALDLNARSIILLHNHPTAGMSFSSQDIAITAEIEDTLKPLGISLYDHLLISADVIYSIRNMHLLNKKSI